MKKLFKEIKKGETFRIWVDSDFYGNPIYNTVTAKSDAIDLSSQHVLSGYGVYQDDNLMYICDGGKQVEVIKREKYKTSEDVSIKLTTDVMEFLYTKNSDGFDDFGSVELSVVEDFIQVFNDSINLITDDDSYCIFRLETSDTNVDLIDAIKWLITAMNVRGFKLV